MSCVENRLVNTQGEYHPNGSCCVAHVGLGSNKRNLFICIFKLLWTNPKTLFPIWYLCLKNYTQRM